MDDPLRPAVVIGYGSRLHRDDALGLLAAEAVASWALAEVSVRAVPQLTPELAADLSRSTLAILIDARPPGDGDDVRVERVAASTTREVSGHMPGPYALLGLCRWVFGVTPTTWLVTIPAACLELGEGLTPTAERSLAEAIERIAAILGDGARAEEDALRVPGGGLHRGREL